MSQGSKKSNSTTIIIIIVAVCAGLGLLVCGGVALLLPAVQQAREAARRSSCKNNLKQIALALHNYHEIHGTFPPAYIADKNGKPMHSWRVLILPYLEQQPLFDRYRFDEPWDGPNNRQLAAMMPDVFRCPSAPDGSPKTHYVVVVGPKTVFPGAESIRFRQIKDGTSSTILTVESPEKAVHWMKPEDISPAEFLRQMESAKGDGGYHGNGTHIGLADGSVRWLGDVSQQAIKKAITRDGMDGDPSF